MNSAPKTAKKAEKPAPQASHEVPAESGEAAKINPQEKPRKHPKEKPVEVGGPKGPEPTRFGDWERKGRCIDF
ncbi:MAG: DUF1674 domain-containing protein [Rhodospirillales bacterium]